MTPILSVVLPTDSFTRIERTVAHLAEQTIAASLELVLVLPDGVGAPESLPAFAGTRVVRVRSVLPLAGARLAGLHAASAPLVGFGETHAYPEPLWAEALVAALDEGWDAVGPAIANANPASLLSWAGLLVDYGQWLERAERAELDDLPGHNSAYRRAALEAFTDDELERFLDAESTLHLALRGRGGRLLLEPRAVLAHVNISRWPPALRERFAAGRRFGAARARTFSPVRRALYALGSPLVPLVRLRRIRGDVRAAHRDDLFPRVLPALAVCLAASALGELAGYATGSGGSSQALWDLELHKLDYLRAGDTLRLGIGAFPDAAAGTAVRRSG